jgi:uncharacterized membrane protein SpoIIM required for sporulation
MPTASPVRTSSVRSTSQRFVEEHRESWQRLETLVRRAERVGIGRFGGAEIDDLALAYRGATSDLAAARGRGYDPRVVAYLERLTARAHARVYAGTGRTGWSNVVRLFAAAFPREVRRSWRAIGACALLTVVCAVLSYRATAADPANAYAFLPPQMIPLADRPIHDANFGFDRTFAPAISAAIITNNIKVSAIALAGGATLGIVTVWIIGFNGLMLGTLGAIFARHGFGLDFWATVAPHGVLELSAIQIAGGAGLVLGAGVLRPGPFRRADAFADGGRRAATLLGGVAAMLAIAGCIEGFVSPQRVGPEVRIAVGALTGVLLAAYLALAGRTLRAPRGS